MRRVAFLLVMASIAAAVVLLVLNVPGRDRGAGFPSPGGDGPATEGGGGLKGLAFLDGNAPSVAEGAVAGSAAAGGGAVVDGIAGQVVGESGSSGEAIGSGGSRGTGGATGTAGHGGNGQRMSAAVLPAGQGDAGGDSSLHALRPLIPRHFKLPQIFSRQVKLSATR